MTLSSFLTPDPSPTVSHTHTHLAHAAELHLTSVSGFHFLSRDLLRGSFHPSFLFFIERVFLLFESAIFDFLFKPTKFSYLWFNLCYTFDCLEADNVIS